MEKLTETGSGQVPETKKETYQVVRGGMYGAGGVEVEVGKRFELSEVPASMSGYLMKLDDLKAGASTMMVASPNAATSTANGEGGTDSKGEKIDYDAMNVSALRELAAGRTPPVVLETSDRKQDVIAKLQAADEGAKRDDGKPAGGEQKIDRAALEQSAKTLGVDFTDATTDDDLLKAVEAKLGD